MIYHNKIFFLLIILFGSNTQQIISGIDITKIREYEQTLKTKEASIAQQLARLKIKENQLDEDTKILERKYAQHQTEGKHIQIKLEQYEHTKAQLLQKEEELQRKTIELQQQRERLSIERDQLLAQQKRIFESWSGHTALEQARASFRKEQEEVKELQRTNSSISRERIAQLKRLEQEKNALKEKQEKMLASNLEYIKLQESINLHKKQFQDLREEEDINAERVKVLHENKHQLAIDQRALTRKHQEHQEMITLLQHEKERLLDRKAQINYEKECLTLGRG